jgi:hypothetical protein
MTLRRELTSLLMHWAGGCLLPSLSSFRVRLRARSEEIWNRPTPFPAPCRLASSLTPISSSLGEGAGASRPLLSFEDDYHRRTRVHFDLCGSQIDCHYRWSGPRRRILRAGDLEAVAAVSKGGCEEGKGGESTRSRRRGLRHGLPLPSKILCRLESDPRLRSLPLHLDLDDVGEAPGEVLRGEQGAQRCRNYFTSSSADPIALQTHCGPDATVYLRFLRGSFYYTCLAVCTVFPTLLSINFIESSEDVSTNSLERASLSSLTKSANGTRL